MSKREPKRTVVQSKEVKLMTIVEYAEYKKVHMKVVQKAMQSGKIPFSVKGGRRYIDPIEADKSWGKPTPEITDPRKQANLDRYATGTDPEHRASTPAEDDLHVQNAFASDASLKAYKAKIAKVEYEQKIGKLIDAEKVAENAALVAKTVRDSMRNIPQKVAAQLASETDVHAIEQLLVREIDTALEELSRYASGSTG